ADHQRRGRRRTVEETRGTWRKHEEGEAASSELALAGERGLVWRSLGRRLRGSARETLALQAAGARDGDGWGIRVAGTRGVGIGARWHLCRPSVLSVFHHPRCRRPSARI